MRAAVICAPGMIQNPMVTVNAGKGYFEDRRPAANMDPYEVCAILIETVCGT